MAAIPAVPAPSWTRHVAILSRIRQAIARFANALAPAETRATAISGLHPGDPALASLFGFGATAAGTHVSEATAFNLSAFFCAVAVISEGLGSLPCILYQRDGDDRRRLTEDPLYNVLRYRPNPEMTALPYRESCQANALVAGNSYSEIVFDGGGRVRAFHRLEPARVRVDRDGDGTLVYKHHPAKGGVERLPAHRVFHIRGLGDGIVGKSVLTHARETIGTALAAEAFGGHFFGNGVFPSNTLTTPGKVTTETRNNIIADLKAQAGGPNAFGVLLLQEGLKWDTRLGGMSMKDAQFLEARQHSVLDFCRWFRIQPNKLAEYGRATWSNGEQMNLDFYTLTLRPWLIRWEEEYWLKVIPDNRKDELFVEFLPDAILRTDVSTRYTVYNIARQMGVLNPNEIRRKENMSPRTDPGGDAYQDTPAGAPPSKEEPPKEKKAGEGDSAEPDGDDEAERSAALAFIGASQVSSMLDATARMAQPILNAQRELLADVLGRMARRVGHAGRVAAKKPSKFMAWLCLASAEHHDVFADAARPVAGLIAAHSGRDVAVVVNDIGGQFFSRFVVGLRDAAVTDKPSNLAEQVDAACTEFETTIAATLIPIILENDHED